MLKSLRYIPLDIPKFEYKNEVISEFSPDNENFYWWKEEYISVRDHNEVWHDPVRLKDRHKKLVAFANQHLPFKSYILFKLVSAKKNVAPHVDDSYLNYKGPNKDFNLVSKDFRDHQLGTEPCGFRILISGSRNSLYLTDKEGGNKSYCQLPESTDCFALKSYGSWHGVDCKSEDANRLVAFIIGWLDPEKHLNLIERSYKKYGSYCYEEEANVLNA